MAADPLAALLDDPMPPAAGVPPGRASVQQPPSQPVQHQPKVERQAIQKIGYSHDGMINMILANRGISQNQLAAHFGYSPSWISQVMSSDAFHARLLERAAELEDPTIMATIEDGLKGMAARSMEILKEKLDQPSSVIPDNLALRTLELATRALGYGARESAVNVQVNVGEHLEKLGDNLTNLLARRKVQAQVVDVDVGES